MFGGGEELAVRNVVSIRRPRTLLRVSDRACLTSGRETLFHKPHQRVKNSKEFSRLCLVLILSFKNLTPLISASAFGRALFKEGASSRKISDVMAFILKRLITMVR